MLESIAHNQDCLEAMRLMADNAFDLAIVDPPYGIGASAHNFLGEKRPSWLASRPKYHYGQWDEQPPTQEFFLELFRISQNQIIFGANHFIDRIKLNSSCWIVWDKDNGGGSFADCELAWTSFNSAVRKFKYRWQGMLQENMKQKENRIHPTQKPVALYKWLLTNYARTGDRILDTHLGSGSSRIAAYDLGFDFTGYELDKDYFDAQEERFARHIAQPKLFEPVKIEVSQESLFV